ncbi:MAG: protein-L-isoaspartate(D-aspartate) O-methyltransferase [Woeseiaceae bacterium]|nr:protein-L-isoaspartate(D-aspartate) O-methyltransferase [Woeseiaceae bacterium]
MTDTALRLAVIFVLLLALPALAQDFATRRADLVDEVRRYADTSGDEPFGDDVLRSLGTVERHKFVPPDQAPYAYENRPLRIGYGQTISQPYIVVLMTDLLGPKPDDVVLEVGTGSGYQAAILSPLVDHVYSIEIIEALAGQAGERLQRLGFENVTTRLGDGYFGWEEHAPFDSIIVTAAASHVPPPLIEQLKPGGRMVIPVGGRFTTQWLLLIEKNDEGGIVTRQIAPVIFVPLTGSR